MRVRVCVIGGGVSGLKVAEMLLESGERSVLLLESREVCGGRIRSLYKGGELMYETGPWRIPSAHKRAVWLFHMHDVPLVPLLTPLPRKKSGAESFSATVLPGMSVYDVNLLETSNPHTADRMDQETGYADQTEADSSCVPYTVRDAGVLSDSSVPSFYVAPSGFSSLVSAMERRVGEERIMRDTRVTDLRRQGDGSYLVECVRRAGEGKRTFYEFEVHADVVFVCTPPRVAREWPSFSPSMRTFLSRVEEGCLHHVYMKGDPAPGRKVHRVDASSPLAQTVSDQYGSGWFQASYSGGRIARFWHRLRMSDPSLFLQFLRRCVRDSFPSARLARKLGSDESDVVSSHFWEGAYHSWRPVPFLDVNKAVLSSVHPNPVLHPHLYWAGEAFSSNQAWIEGALQTASLSVLAWKKEKEGHGGEWDFPRRRKREGEMVAEGRILDVSSWEERHPGGASAIRGHVGEGDVSRTMSHIGHSDVAWATLPSLQVAWESAE